MEVLVVIAIIGLLVGILLPALSGARTRAQEIKCMSALQQWGVGIANYAASFHNDLPQKGPDGTSAFATGSASTAFFGGAESGVIGYNDPSLWFNAVPPLVGGKSYYQLLVDDSVNPAASPAPRSGMNSIFICPTVGPPIPSATGGDITYPQGQTPLYFLLYGTDSWNQIKNSTGLNTLNQFKFDCSYVWNSKLTSPNNSALLDGYTAQLYPLRITAIRDSSSTVLMLEKIGAAYEYMDPDVQAYAKANSSAYGLSINSRGFIKNVAQAKACWTRFAARHRGGGFLLFADGHVSWSKWRDAQYRNGQSQSPQYSDANQPGRLVWCTLGPTGTGGSGD